MSETKHTPGPWQVRAPGTGRVRATVPIVESEHGDRVYCDLPVYSDQGVAVRNKIRAIMGAYNHDGSEIQTDHFDVKFYGDADFDWQMVESHKKALIAGMEGAA